MTVNDLELHVKVSGEGPPLLLLHGFTGSSESWESFIQDWSQNYQTIAVDLIGHGKSDSPADPIRYTMQRAVQDLTALLDHLNIQKTSILGYSMGGRLALSFAALQPSRVQALLLESTSPGLVSQEDRQARLKQDEKLADHIEHNGISWFVQYWENIPLFHRIKSLPEPTQLRIREQRLGNDPTGLANSLRGMGTGAQPSWWAELESMSFPVLLMAGEQDEKFHGIADQMNRLLPQSTLSIVSGAGHLVHVEQPEIFGTIVEDFLNQVHTQKG